MGEHHDHHEAVPGPWAGGWLIAALAALAAVGMTRIVSGVGADALILIAGVTFLVTGILCGNGGVELTLSDDHGHDGHDHHH